MHIPFLVMGLISNLNGADNHMIHTKTDIRTLFDNEDDKVFHGFTAKYIFAATAIVHKLLN